VIVVPVVVVFVVLVAIPFSMPFTVHAGSDDEEALIVPAGSHVSGTFSTNNSDTVDFLILGAGHNPIYQADASPGSFSVAAPSGGVTIQIFLFGQSCTVAASGTYTAPILWSPSFPVP